MLVNGDTPRPSGVTSPNFVRSPTEGITSSVRLRRNKHRDVAQLANGDGRRNRHSGDFVHWSPSRQLQEERKNRKSGDWSYVSFPQSPPTRGMHFESMPPMGQSSILESKVIASIIQNEQTEGSPVARCRSAMETLDRKPPVNQRRDELAEVYASPRQVQNRRPEPEAAKSRRPQSADGRRTKRRSQSNQGRQSRNPDRYSDLLETRSVRSEDHRSPMVSRLGPRSATQLELSRRTRGPSEEEERARVRWSSQENIEQLPSNFTGESESNNPIASDEPPPDPPTSTTIKKGLLWQQRDKLFSRWKERFFILTTDYLQCFKKGSSRITEMGGFIFKVRLSEIVEVELLDKRGYLTISLSLAKDGKILLRKPEGIREWYQSIKSCARDCRSRNMKSTEEFWSKRQFNDSSSIEHWLLARQRIGSPYTDSSPMTRPNEFISLPSNCGNDDNTCREESRPASRARNASKTRKSQPAYVAALTTDLEDLSVKSSEGTKSPFDCGQDSGNDSMHTNTSTGGSTDSSNHVRERSRSKSRTGFRSSKEEEQQFRGRASSEQRSKEAQSRKLHHRRSQLPPQSTRV